MFLDHKSNLHIKAFILFFRNWIRTYTKYSMTQVWVMTHESLPIGWESLIYRVYQYFVLSLLSQCNLIAILF